MSEDTVGTIETAGAVASSGVATANTVNFILTLVLKTSMNQMLSAIKNLQVIVHLGLLGIALPGIASIFFKSIQTMIAFDPIPNADAYIEEVF